jgi:hypothetical protein
MPRLLGNDTNRAPCCVHPQVFLYFAEKEDVLTRFFDGEHACAETSMILTTGQESEIGALPDSTFSFVAHVRTATQGVRLRAVSVRRLVHRVFKVCNEIFGARLPMRVSLTGLGEPTARGSPGG